MSRQVHCLTHRSPLLRAEERSPDGRTRQHENRSTMSGRVLLRQQAQHKLELRQQQGPKQDHLLRQPTTGDMPGYYQLNGALDQRDIVWPKLQVIQHKYLADMEALYLLMTGFDTQVLSADHARKFNLYKEIVRRLLTYLRVTRENLPLEFKQNLLDSFAEQIVSIIDIFRKKPDRDDDAAAASFSGNSRQETGKDTATGL